ncbi:retropepsin-like aspartic protease family protein [Cohaesibacter celericrescens]|uniref:TIGR02281 family clan AA aspartic protease n=1 Tax=Cohaesibacter celericrescens TaxID=2067669 RepID=A0A2N5XQJ9_9HYPH|nr:TIGR02281 family clan AA aspartic protease [Cohaesibacter celericrescens]PLW76783.1 TIGR02281 family clan AA aspartic protease [Cohaesibacter celericrescens]
MFYVILGIMATAVAVLMFNHEAGEVFGYPIEIVASIALSSSLLLYLIGGNLGRSSLLQSLKQAATWLLIGFALVLGYSFKDDAKLLVSRVTGELLPGAAVVSQSGEVTFRRSDNGHFMVRAQINGETVPMLVDSGASSIVLSYSDATKTGLDLGALSFSAPVSTANGRALAAQVWLQQISVGGIEAQSVPAMVAQKGALRESLLGMSFLDRLEGWSVSGDRLTMIP